MSWVACRQILVRLSGREALSYQCHPLLGLCHGCNDLIRRRLDNPLGPLGKHLPKPNPSSLDVSHNMAVAVRGEKQSISLVVPTGYSCNCATGEGNPASCLDFSGCQAGSGDVGVATGCNRAATVAEQGFLRFLGQRLHGCSRNREAGSFNIFGGWKAFLGKRVAKVEIISVPALVALTSHPPRIAVLTCRDAVDLLTECRLATSWTVTGLVPSSRSAATISTTRRT